MTFLEVIPELMQDLEFAINKQYATELKQHYQLPNFLRMGSWIGGDRDGNPFVNATTLATAIDKQAITACGYYLKELDALRRELSLSIRLVDASPELIALSEDSTDQSPHRQDECYRLALNAIYARMLATSKQITVQEDLGIDFDTKPYAQAEDLLHDLNIIADSLQQNHGQALIYPRLGKLIKAVDSFGFHLATIDIRQSSDVHEAVIKELF